LPDVEEQSSQRALHRLVTFIDAIVAIAITLLVLPLVDLTGDIQDGEAVSELLRTHQARLWSFLLSFAVIASLWLGQHRVMTHVVRSHPRVTQVLLLWSLTIVFLPFPTALVASPASAQTGTKALYAGTILASSALLLLLDWVIMRHPAIADGTRLDPARALATVGALAVAFVLMVCVPSTGYYPMLLLVLVSPALDVRARRRSRRSVPSERRPTVTP